MKFQRKDKQTGKFAYIILALLGLGVIYVGLSQLSWGWNILTLPIGFLIASSGYKNFKRSKLELIELEFLADSVVLTYINGKSKTVPNEKFNFAILIKRFHQPVRALVFREKGKLGLRKGKKIAELRVKKWPEINKLGKYLIRKKFNRVDWSFDLTFGGVLMLFGLLLGLGGIGDGDFFEISSDVAEIGDLLDDEKQKQRDFDAQSEKKFIDKAQNENP